MVSQLVAEKDQARVSISSTYRSRRSRSDTQDSRRRGRSRSPSESRYGEASRRRESSYRRPRTPPRPPPRNPSPLPRRRPPASDGWLAKSFGFACKGGWRHLLEQEGRNPRSFCGAVGGMQLLWTIRLATSRSAYDGLGRTFQAQQLKKGKCRP